MPADVELARREGIELIHTGSWSALSGTWKPTRADILAAVEAQQCPAVRRPRLKLGHTDPRFNEGGDGEPALGWIENLRAADDGNTLIGDQVALPWLSAVQAAAYPDRSIEGNYRHVCALGHTHPFVLTAVALLGVAPPAVSTLRSVQDLPAMLGVAASSEVPEGAEHVQVTVLAGRHSWDESKYRRDGDGQFTSGAGGTSGGGETAAPAGSGLKRNESLAKRIPLAAGETYVGSGAVRNAGFAVAAIDSPEGRKVRLGVGIDPDEASKWSAANRGGTVVLDQERLDQTREAIAQLLDAAKVGKAKVRALYREWDRLEAAESKLASKDDRSDAEESRLEEIREQRKINDAELEALTDFGVLEEGVISTEWGDLHLQAYMSDDSPQFKVEVRAGRRAPTRFDEILEVSHMRRLAALLEKAGAMKPVQAAAETVHAATEVHTGAMIALLPTVEDAARLTVDGGEPAEELHVTLAYLGDAAALGAHGQQDVIDAVSAAVNGLPQVDADLFSVNVFNPPGMTSDDGRTRDTCLVWGLSGDLIDAVHNLIIEALWQVPTPEQHRPWHCHMTAAYTADLGRIPELAAKVGPVRFDRVRLAFAGQHIDIPLIPDGEQPSVAASARFATRLAELQAGRVAASADLPPEPVEDPAPQLPAAEPEQPPTDPKEEDPVSDTDLSGFRSRLGLTDDATQDDILGAIDALKAKADIPPAPTEEMVAASAAATRAIVQAETARAEMQTELQRLSGELASIKASAATSAKTSLFDSAITAGKIKPAERESWEGRYDRAPDVITEILASIAPGTAVPVMASGSIGSPEPETDSDDWDAIVARLDGPTAGKVN